MNRRIMATDRPFRVAIVPLRSAIAPFRVAIVPLRVAIAAAIGVLLVVHSPAAQAADAAARKPNIVYILADDMGYGDPGFMGLQGSPHAEHRQTRPRRHGAHRLLCSIGLLADAGHADDRPLRNAHRRLPRDRAPRAVGAAARRTHARAGTPRRRLRNGDRRQVASRRIPAPLSTAEPRLRSSIWPVVRNGRLFHAQAGKDFRLASRRSTLS